MGGNLKYFKRTRGKNNSGGKIIGTNELYEKHRFPTDQKCFQSNKKAFTAEIKGVGNFGVSRRK